ncbi:hypothetical protein ACFVY0_44765 [Streptomyces sp. NPDC058286]|uniref:hypothetical protein n=1 Tax=Streptomyces sp. NPDC058286 TaxID=3346422 RepID=UPI0036E96ADE
MLGGSIASCQRILVVIQSATYWQRSALNGGSQVAGSWSALDRIRRCGAVRRAGDRFGNGHPAERPEDFVPV